MDQDVGERIEDPAQHEQRPRDQRGEAHRHGLRQHLGQHLAEEQQQERHQHGLEEELEIPEDEERVDDPGREDRDADVHQVVYHEDRGQQQVHVRQQAQHGVGRGGAALLEAAHIVSAPETSAEIHSRQHVTAQSTTTCGVKPLKVIQGRVVSKVGMLG